jgi:hypothetical protein
MDPEVLNKFKILTEKKIVGSMNLKKSKLKRKEDQIHLAKLIKTQFINK